MVTLSKESILSSTEALESGYTGAAWADFVVPAGKKFIALSITLSQGDRGGTGVNTIKMGNGLVSGTISDYVWQFQMYEEANSSDSIVNIPVYLDTFPAGHYVNVEWASTDRHGMSVTGILTDV